MNSPLTYLKAARSFLKCLFRPSLPVTGYSPNGHTILKHWEQAPEEGLIDRYQAIHKERTRTQKLALFCYEGPHHGELFPLGNSLETLGSSIDNTVVLSPSDPNHTQKFRILVNGKSVMMAETGEFFQLNSLEEQKGELLDYDEIHILGNKFVVLDVSYPFLEESVQ